MVDKKGIKVSQIFGWDIEPKTERTSLTRPVNAAADRRAAPSAGPAGAAGWEAQRQAPNERDQSLSFVALGWQEKFAPADRPTNLCTLYPRVANRLALCWPDVALTLHLLEGLLVDKRGKRQGFPSPVAAELIRLRRLRSLPPGV